MNSIPIGTLVRLAEDDDHPQPSIGTVCGPGDDPDDEPTVIVEWPGGYRRPEYTADLVTVV